MVQVHLSREIYLFLTCTYSSIWEHRPQTVTCFFCLCELFVFNSRVKARNYFFGVCLFVVVFNPFCVSLCVGFARPRAQGDTAHAEIAESSAQGNHKGVLWGRKNAGLR
jgi:hypothetical protein